MSPASTIGPSGFLHEAVFHHGPRDLAAQLTPIVRSAVDGGDTVLLCLDRDVVAALQGAVPLSDEAVRIMPLDDRYARPGVAMAALHDFVATSLASGARRACSIGTLPFDGTARDARWLRYEAAVDELLGGRALHAVCTFDTGILGDDLLCHARRLHTHDGPPLGPHDCGPVDATAKHPTSAPTLDLVDVAPAAVRGALTELLAGLVDERVLGDVHLVATELLANGLRHGRPPVWLRAWADERGVVVQVGDRGPGPDPIADLLPRRGGEHGGYGLWLVGQLVDWLDVEVVAEGHRITACVPVAAG